MINALFDVLLAVTIGGTLAVGLCVDVAMLTGYLTRRRGK
jgi:hypothetical protein